MIKSMITFIIPTINRKSLQESINSLLAQTNPNWKAIIVFDGVSCTNYSDSRIKSLTIQKTGKANHAGQVRNFGINLAETDWVAFLDDDDTISNNYVEKFYEEIKENPDAKCIIFRMKTEFEPGKILPEPSHNDFYRCKVGISFAIKKELNILFEPSAVEDFILLHKIRHQKHKMIISPYVTYFVREKPSAMPIFNRVKINY